MAPLRSSKASGDLPIGGCLLLGPARVLGRVGRWLPWALVAGPPRGPPSDSRTTYCSGSGSRSEDMDRAAELGRDRCTRGPGLGMGLPAGLASAEA